MMYDEKRNIKKKKKTYETSTGHFAMPYGPKDVASKADLGDPNGQASELGIKAGMVVPGQAAFVR